MHGNQAPTAPAGTPAVSPDDRADRLAEVAVELVTRVRDYPADANWRWLLATLPEALDREALAFVLAAAVPVDEPWSHLTGWARVARETV